MKYTCPKHGVPLVVELVRTGSWKCDCAEYCYCESPDMHVELKCPWKPKRGWGTCNHRVKIVEGLTDEAGIERWIAERLLTEGK
jgi:hypothetical protein